jgi:hypothetical protein
MEYDDKLGKSNVYYVKIKDEKGERFINAYSWEYAVYEINKRKEEQEIIEKELEEIMQKFGIKKNNKK